MSLAPLENVDQEAVLRTLNLDVRKPETQALLLICEKYKLDPLLKHIVLIQGRPYITRDGYLHIAHQSGVFDGIEIIEEGVYREAGEKGYWWAKATVYRKDMSHPFTYRGRYPLKGGNSAYGPEMAIKCAECMTLRRAFPVFGFGAAEERWDADIDEGITPQVVAELADRLNALGPEARQRFRNRFQVQRAHELAATDEQDAIEFVQMLEDEAEFPLAADETESDAAPADEDGVELDTPARDTSQEELGL